MVEHYDGIHRTCNRAFRTATDPWRRQKDYRPVARVGRQPKRALSGTPLLAVRDDDGQPLGGGGANLRIPFGGSRLLLAVASRGRTGVVLRRDRRRADVRRDRLREATTPARPVLERAGGAWRSPRLLLVPSAAPPAARRCGSPAPRLEFRKTPTHSVPKRPIAVRHPDFLLERRPDIKLTLSLATI